MSVFKAVHAKNVSTIAAAGFSRTHLIAAAQDGMFLVGVLFLLVAYFSASYKNMLAQAAFLCLFALNLKINFATMEAAADDYNEKRRQAQAQAEALNVSTQKAPIDRSRVSRL